jgi:hypothetical protein
VVAFDVHMVAAYQVTSGAGAVVSAIVLGLLFALWVWALFAIVADSIGAGAKIFWFVAVTCLAPIAVPVYMVLRHRRHATATA